MLVKILFIFLAATLFLGVLLNEETIMQNQFEAFKAKYGKKYEENQQFYRQYVFQKNSKMIEDHNSKGGRNYEMGVNSFADITRQEFKMNYLGLQTRTSSNSKGKDTPGEQSSAQIIQMEVEINWKKAGKVTRVKNQHMCGSCWAFCSIGALQSAYMIHKGINQQFSQQQLVDCSTSFGNKGCAGGQLEYTFQYFKAKGIAQSQMYPYVAKQQNCKKVNSPYKLAAFGRDVTCGGLYMALLRGPVAVAVDALFWGFYKSGIYDDCGNEVNHGVLVVGANADYWWVKNSWGSEWGIEGYIQVKRGNTCSICEYPFFPLLE